jgi:hypothetical protein
MTETSYYAIILRGHATSDPSGVARRRMLDGVVVDESLQRDMTWAHTSAIAEWDHGEELTLDLVEISESEALELIERFRERWGGGA